MDVSNRTVFSLKQNPVGEAQVEASAQAEGGSAPALGGEELVNQVISLTGLPEGLVQEELDLILDASGKSSADLTLEELRTAMLSYLESLQSELMTEGTQ